MSQALRPHANILCLSVCLPGFPLMVSGLWPYPSFWLGSAAASSRTIHISIWQGVGTNPPSADCSRRLLLGLTPPAFPHDGWPHSAALLILRHRIPTRQPCKRHPKHHSPPMQHSTSIQAHPSPKQEVGASAANSRFATEVQPCMAQHLTCGESQSPQIESLSSTHQWPLWWASMSQKPNQTAETSYTNMDTYGIALSPLSIFSSPVLGQINACRVGLGFSAFRWTIRIGFEL